MAATSPQKHPIVMGHRGAVYLEPENTLPSFQLCGKLGIDAVELDVFRLIDDALVVFHGGKGPQRDPQTGEVALADNGFLASMADISTLDISSPDPYICDLNLRQVQSLQLREDAYEFVCPRDRIAACPGIPTLREVLQACKDAGVHVTVELKGPNTAEPSLCMVQDMGMLSSVTFSSFAHDQIIRVKTLCSSAYTAALFEPPLPADFVALTKAALADEVDMNYQDCTPEIISEAKAAGLRTMVWCSGPRNMKVEEDSSFYASLASTGVDVMCVNRPDVLRTLFLAAAH